MRRAAARLCVLLTIGALSLSVDDLRITLALVAATVVWALRAGAPMPTLLRQLRTVAPIALAVGLAHVLLGAPMLALVAVLRIVTLVLAAGVVTAVTPTADLLAVIERAARPLRHVGIDPTRVGLTLLMTIRLIPLLADMLERIRDAQRSRGVERPVVSTVGPLVIAALRAADQLADALDARGLSDGPVRSAER